MKIIEDITFKELTTFRIGGKVKYYAEVKNEEEIIDVLKFAENKKIPIFIIGGGSDFLANDRDFDGLVIKYTANKYKINGEEITADSGMIWDDLVKVSVDAGLFGIECLSGVPGTVGASPIQNVGAYGQEVKDTFVKLKAFSIEDKKFVEFDKDECKFEYRSSIFKNEKYWQKYLITEVVFKLKKETKPNFLYESLKGLVRENSSLCEIREAVLKVRAQKLEDPNKFGNAGSFFKNPVFKKDQKEKIVTQFPDIKIYPYNNGFKVSAAWLIEKAGWKAKTLGGAAVSSKHSLILINKTGNASADEIYNLSEIIIEDIYKKFGIKLEREVQLINY